MKSVLISIQPKWCDLIFAGKKTVEIRRSKPKLEAPFKVYIYCTLSGSNELFKDVLHGDVAAWNRGKWGLRKGNVIGEFVCDKAVEFPHNWYDPGYCESCTLACIDEYDLSQYLGDSEVGYGWHITDLKIYNEPKPLSMFYKECAGLDNTGMCYECENAVGEECDCALNGHLHLARPPQSWCYVEGFENA